MLACSSGGNARVDYAQELGSLRAAAGKTWRHAPRTARFIAKAASPVLGPFGVTQNSIWHGPKSAGTVHRLGGFSRRHPVLAQRLPANPRTAEREERCVDVGSFVVADAEPAKLVEPRKRPLDHQRHRPKPLPCLVRRIASSGRMWRARKPCRMAAAS